MEDRKEKVTTNSSSDAPPDKKKYRAPELVEWGSIRDLTKGDAGGTSDDGFTGTVT